MFAEGEPLSSYSPFWFAKEDLLIDLLRAEFHSIRELFAKHPGLREFFDFPEATPQQRAACFAVLAHRNLVGEIYDQFAGLWQQSPSLGDEENEAIALTQNLFTDDAPAWVLEVNEVAELLPSRIYKALPEPLRRGGFNGGNAEEVEFINSVASKLSSVEHIHALTEKVLDEQLRRLQGRWSLPAVQVPEQNGPKGSKLSKRSFKGTEGLGHKKADFSQYMADMTDKQQLAFSLKYEYELRLTAIASRMGIDRTTAREHLDAANRKLEQNRAFEKRKANRSKNNLEY
jgi:hypothetical protein